MVCAVVDKDVEDSKIKFFEKSCKSYAFSFPERLPVRTLDMFAKMPMFIDGLSSDTKLRLINNKRLVEKLSLLPKSSLLSVVVNNWDILTTLPKDTVRCH